MNADSILISSMDYGRLLALMEQEGEVFEPSFVDWLDQKLVNAEVVESRSVPPDVVTMNSRVRYEHASSNGSREVALVYPPQASPERGLVSVLSPIGISLLGQREGDVSGIGPRPSAQRVRITRITYQPEAAGHWYL